MSKRLLVALMALSVVSAYACDDDKKDDGNGGAQTGCVHKATRCSADNNYVEVCANGVWKEKSKDCVGNGTVCKVDPGTNKADCEAPSAELSCDSNGVPQSCLNGVCTTLTPCNEGWICKGAGECVEIAKMCKEGDKQCKGSTPEVCDANGDWIPGTACDASTEVCSAGNCVNKSELCLESSETCTVGKPCDNNEFQQICTDGNAHAIVCSNFVITQYDCADNECAPNTENSKRVVCKKGLPEDIPTSCVKNEDKGLCSSVDGKAYVCGDTGYYANNKCTGTCFECPDNFWVGCGDSIEVACAGHMSLPESCDETYVSSCSEDGTKGYFCSQGKVKTKSCTDPDWKCSNDDGYIDCNTCEGAVTTGGEENGCCDSANYVETCAEDGSYLLQCIKNKITKKYCANNACAPSADDPNVLVCRNASLPAEIPDTCVKGTSKGLCGSDNMPYICGDAGYYKGSCNGTCFECPDNYWVACGASEEAACVNHMTPAETCDKTQYQPYCSDDLKKGYFCSNGKVKETDCPDANCVNENGFISCGGRPVCTAESTGSCKSACSADASEGYYWGSGKLNVQSCPNKDCILDANGHVACEGGSVPAENCTAASTAACTKNCKADGSEGYYWASGKVNVVTCENNDCTIDSQNHVVCGGGNTLANPHDDDRTPGASCDKTSYYGACSDDFTKRYYCDNNTQVVVEKPCENGCDPASLGNNGSKCKSGGTTPTENCTASSTAYCQKNCSADGSVGYYWGSGKVNTVNCPNNDCIIDSQNHVVCSGGSSSSCEETVATGGNEGDCCEASSYTPSCINGNANALICSKGKVKQWSCKDNVCSYDSSTNKITCPDPNGGSTNTEANPNNDDRTPGASCDKTTYYGACSDDFANRYYCDNNTQVVVEKPCANGCDPASLGNNGSKCKSGSTTPTEDCNASSTGKCKAVCTTDGSTGYYWNGTSNAVVPVSCPNNDCNVSEGGYVACGTCDVNTYETNCVGNTAKRCRNGQIISQTCNPGKTCVVRTDGTCTVASSQCVGGQYNTDTYAHGYFECI